METQIIIALLTGVVLGMLITLWIVSQTPRYYYH